MYGISLWKYFYFNKPLTQTGQDWDNYSTLRSIALCNT